MLASTSIRQHGPHDHWGHHFRRYAGTSDATAVPATDSFGQPILSPRHDVRLIVSQFVIAQVPRYPPTKLANNAYLQRPKDAGSVEAIVDSPVVRRGDGHEEITVLAFRKAGS